MHLQLERSDQTIIGQPSIFSPELAKPFFCYLCLLGIHFSATFCYPSWLYAWLCTKYFCQNYWNIQLSYDWRKPVSTSMIAQSYCSFLPREVSDEGSCEGDTAADDGGRWSMTLHHPKWYVAVHLDVYWTSRSSIRSTLQLLPNYLSYLQFIIPVPRPEGWMVRIFDNWHGDKNNKCFWPTVHENF